MTNLIQQLIDEEEGPSSKTVYYVQGLAHVARGCCIDPKVPGAGLCDAALSTQDAFDIQRAGSLASVLDGWDKCNDVQQAVLVSLCFQMGSMSGWPDFKHALAAGDYELAADNLLYESPPQTVWSLFHKQTPARCEREAEMLRTGKWVPYTPR